MVWTLPTITNTQLSNVKIFNSGVPVDVILEPQVDVAEQTETSIFQQNVPEFVETMSSELRQLFDEITQKKTLQTDTLLDLIIQKNRLLYIGIVIVFTSLLLWFVSSIFQSKLN